MTITLLHYYAVTIVFLSIRSGISTSEVSIGPRQSGLFWKNLNVRSSEGNYLLQKFSGFIPNGQVCGLLGPSGAGKTTVLSALGDNILPSSGLQVSGDVMYYNGKKHEAEHLMVQSGRVAWLQQHDDFFSMLTVQETLNLASYLELPLFSESQRLLRVSNTMDSLGLKNLRHRRIGDASLNKGLSGGERRRLSLALELISSPKLFIGDEPTSGLDSTLSNKVVRLIKKLVVKRNIPCVLSLHQPRSSIWRMLDSVILLAPGGRVCYMGDTHSAVSYFASLGFNCPKETNPAEFLLDLVSVDSEDPEAATQDKERISKLVKAFAARQPSEHYLHPREAFSVVPSVMPHGRGRLSLRQFVPRCSRLFMRSWRQNTRNHWVNGLRLVASAGNAILFSLVFNSVKKDFFTAKSVAERTALLTLGVTNMAMLALTKTIDLFAKEKPVVRREQRRQQYSSVEYLLSKSLAEIPLDTAFAAVFTGLLKVSSGIRSGWKELTGTFALMTACGASLGFAIGAFSPTAEIAMSAGIPWMSLLLTVGVINPSGVDPSVPKPVVIAALKKLSPIAYAVQAVCLTEFRGIEFESPNRPGMLLRGRDLLNDLPRIGALAFAKNGDQVLEALGLGQESYGASMRHLAVLSAINLVVSWLGLKVQGGMKGATASRKLMDASNGQAKS